MDGVATVAGIRMLLIGQTAGTKNGIYVATDTGSTSAPWVLERSADFEESGDIFAALKVSVAEGAAYSDVACVLTADDPITQGAAPLVFLLARGSTRPCASTSRLFPGSPRLP